MKLAIIGSRKPVLHDDIFFARMDELFHDGRDGFGDPIEQIISGGAPGIDTQAEVYAQRFNIPLRVIRPDYDKYSPQEAPKIRNEKIAKACDLAVVFWNGELISGTRNALNHLKRLKKTTIIVYI